MINAIDIAFAVIALLMLLAGVIKGFVMTLVGMLRFVVAVPLSVYVSDRTSDLVYQSYVRNFVIDRLTDRITELGSVDSFVSSLTQKNSLVGDIILDSIPEAQLERLEPPKLSVTLTDNFLAPILQGGVKLAIFIAVFLAFYLVTALVMLIIRKAGKKDKSPLKTVDRVLGGVLGLVKSVIAVGVLSVIFLLIASFDSEGSNSFVKLINDSQVINFINNFDLFGGII
ncbi:MAG: CvpA family protein [Eubacterium sp.]|nr:CvpA family protein [Eubacterium sp.]